MKFSQTFRPSGALGGIVLLLFASPLSAEIYSGPRETNHAIDGAVAADDQRIVEWADVIDSTRTMFGPRGSSSIDQNGGFNSLGDLDTAEIADGDLPGFLTVQFPTGIGNGAGHDFAVFENGFTFGTNADGTPGLFAEFAYVDVSTNGSDFARFPSISLNTGALSGGFGSNFSPFDVTNVYNLAGKHAAGFGTPFDLDDLQGNALVAAGLLDLDNIQYVRLVDIPGDGSSLDSQGNPIVDNWLTSGSGGFDFRLGEGLGVGVMNISAVPEPGSFALLGLIATIGSLRRKRVGRSLKPTVQCQPAA
ncbi:PEP-CTERM sorting domain-containing protein [Rhodopirellula sp. JC639]|uniref:PEP-CTERM sorting domain-containing protein n=1 Tax=Stieleria mannarensis TaxID=2755585 RepID=UPI0015FFA20E|nr:PEP-CTERM sorting domain-containing protein [Rhodopirellula sp. JC639]